MLQVRFRHIQPVTCPDCGHPVDIEFRLQGSSAELTVICPEGCGAIHRGKTINQQED